MEKQECFEFDIPLAERCKHCQSKARQEGRRGLCGTCHDDEGVRGRYPMERPEEPVQRGGPGDPCPHPPGSEGKIARLMERASLGMVLWHPEDETMDYRTMED